MKKAKVQPDEYTKEILNSPARGEALGRMRMDMLRIEGYDEITWWRCGAPLSQTNQFNSQMLNFFT